MYCLQNHNIVPPYDELILSVNQAYDKTAKNEMHESVKLKDVEYDAMKPIYQNLSAMVVPSCTVKKKER